MSTTFPAHLEELTSRGTEPVDLSRVQNECVRAELQSSRVEISDLKSEINQLRLELRELRKPNFRLGWLYYMCMLLAY